MKLFIRVLGKIVNRPAWLAALFTGVVTSSALLYSYMEDLSFFDGVWWTVVTACTVGYGDQYPHTSYGRVLATVVMLIMILVIVPVITAQLSAATIVDRDKFTHEEQEEQKRALALLPELVASLGRLGTQLEQVLSEVDEVEEKADEDAVTLGGIQLLLEQILARTKPTE